MVQGFFATQFYGYLCFLKFGRRISIAFFFIVQGGMTMPNMILPNDEWREDATKYCRQCGGPSCVSPKPRSGKIHRLVDFSVFPMRGCMRCMFAISEDAMDMWFVAQRVASARRFFSRLRQTF